MSNCKFSGKTDISSTGAQRDCSDGKPRPDLISPFFMMRVGDRLGKGAEIHGERNWEQGVSLSRTYQSLQRHLQQWALGDEEEDHLAGAACNLVFLVHYEEMIRRGLLPVELDDMPRYLSQTRGQNEHLD